MESRAFGTLFYWVVMFYATVDGGSERPNYFFAIQIPNADIHSALQDVQDYVVSGDERLEDARVMISKTHITLFVFHISNKNDLNVVKDLMVKSLHQYEMIAAGPLNFKLQGLGNFDDRVLFGKPIFLDASVEVRFQILWQMLADNLKSAGLIDSADFQSYTPHVTVLKLSSNSETESIDPNLYQSYVNKQFGAESVLNNVQLNSMKGSDGGYYHIEKEIPLY